MSIGYPYTLESQAARLDHDAHISQVNSAQGDEIIEESQGFLPVRQVATG
jgi:hypothetical protein